MFKIFNTKENEKVDIKRLNEIIKIMSLIMKIVFILLIILILFMGTNVLRTWGVFTFITTMLKILLPFFIGVTIAWLLNPIVTKLQKMKINRIWGTVIVYGVFVIGLVLIITSIIPTLSMELNDFVKTVPSSLEKIKDFINNVFENFRSPSYDIDSIKKDLYKQVEDFVTGYTSSIPSMTLDFIKTFMETLLIIVVGLLIGLYLLFNFDRSIENIASVIPLRIREEFGDLGSRINQTLKNFVYGTLLTSCIIFVVYFLGFYFAGLKASLFFALFGAVMNIIPYAGPYLGSIPAIIVGFTISPVTGIVVLVICLCIQFIEGNFVHPMVMSKTMKLHPVTILVGLLVFGYFYGMMGMIIAMPIISMAKITLTYFNEKYKIIDLPSKEKKDENTF